MEQSHTHDHSQSRNWQELAGEALLDHLNARSLSILASHEIEQNGPSA